MRYFVAFFLFVFSLLDVQAQELRYKEIRGIAYSSSKDSYVQKQCLLDFYYPEDKKDFTTLIWFHGGGLTSGNRAIPERLKGGDFAVVSVGYRFAPQVRVEDIIKDGAEAISWVMKNIANYGGNTQKVVIGGYSAGAYLALMLALRKEYLAVHSVDADQLLGVISCSGQAITHFTERQSRHIRDTQPIVDEMAPLYWVRNTPFPIMLMTGDRELEMLGRYEENAYLARMLKLCGHKDVKLLEFQGFDHGMLTPALPLVVRQLKEWEALRLTNSNQKSESTKK